MNNIELPHNIGRKIVTIGIGIVYLFSYIVHTFVVGNVFAENTLQQTNIVAIFVDKNIYDSLSSDLQRYASSYIQGNISHTKATVFPINIETFKAKDIVRMLENMYFDGIHNQASKLIGTILIGDIPLPVVRHDGFLFPSIYPYVDFEDQQYIYNAKSSFFDYNNNPNAQAEIWHGIINFNQETSAYIDYFQKLKTYASDPSGFVDAKIRYDDFSALKKYFVDGNLKQYAHKHLFGEDTAYRRFSTLFLQTLQANHNNDIAQLGSVLTDSLSTSFDMADTDDQDTLLYNAALGGYGSNMQQLFDDNADTLATNQNIPTYTLFLDTLVPEFLKGYNTLFGNIYSEILRDNVFAGGRWIGQGDIDTHSKKIMGKDDVYFRDISEDLDPTLKTFNSILEQTLDAMITQEQYALAIPMPLHYTEESKLLDIPNACRDQSKTYDYYFFGRKATTINSIMDTHIYRGTYQNLSGLNGIQHSNGLGSVGSSYAIFSQQIQANRAYNFSEASNEIDIWEREKIQGIYETDCQGFSYAGLCFGSKTYEPAHGEICREYNNGDVIYEDDEKEIPLDFAIRRRGGASPINLIVNPQNPNDHIINIPQNFRYFAHALEPIYAIQGSKSVEQLIPNTNTQQAITDFGSMIQVADQSGPIQYPRCIDTRDTATNMGGLPFVQKQIKTTNIDYFYAFAASTGPLARAIATQNSIQLSNEEGSCFLSTDPPYGSNDYMKRIWEYKTIDSKYYHISPSPDQINTMNTTTRDRPIDSVRMVSFVGLGGETITLPYPNLYATPVYTQSGDTLTLQTPTQIEDALKQHLREYVDTYNQQLQRQLNTRLSYYNSNPGAFDLLAQHNAVATPNRQYTLIPSTLFIDALGDSTIATIAEILYYHNLPWYQKTLQETVEDDIQYHSDTLDINHKIHHVMHQYLTSDNDKGPLVSPGYVANGYEVAYIHSDGIHTIDTDTIPAIIQDIQSSQNIFRSQAKPKASAIYDQSRQNIYNEQTACLYNPSVAVPLIQRPAAFSCWASELLKKPLSISLTFPDYKSFGNTLSNQFDNYSQGLSHYSTQRSHAVNLEQNNQTIINNLPGSQQRSLQDVMQYTRTQTNVNSWYVDPNNEQEKYIELSSSKNIGTTYISISATGDNCLTIVGKSNNLCSNPIVVNQNLFDTPTKLLVTLGNPAQTHSSKAGLTTLLFRLCTTSNSQSCIYKTQQVNILPSAIFSLDIVAPNSTTHGNTMPVIVTAKDRFNNTIGLGLEDFTLTVSTGTLFDGNTKDTSISFNDFRKAQFVYTAPDDITIPHNTPVTLIARSSSTGENSIFAAKEVLIKKPVVSILSNNRPVGSIEYKLPNTLDAIKTIDTDGIEQVSLTNIPSLTISLVDDDGVPLNSYIQIHSSNNLLQASVSDTIRVAGRSHTILKPQSDFLVIDGSLTIYFEPTYKAGNDLITLRIPGIEPISLPVSIAAGDAHTVHLSHLPSFAATKQSFSGHIHIYDIRGNPVVADTQVALGSLGGVSTDSSVLVSGGSGSMSIYTHTPGGISHIYATLQNIPITEHLPDYARITVQDDILPRDDLNVMYLNLFGTDRGNQRGYFSSINKSYINDRIKNSSKLLTTTTQLIDPNKIKEVNLLVSPSLKVKQFGGQTVSILSEPGVGLSIALADSAHIRIGESQTFALSQTDDITSIPIQANGSRIVYMPSPTDSFIRSNIVQGSSIQVNDEVVFDIDTLSSRVSITLSDEQYQGYPLRHVSYNSRIIGKMLIQRSDQILLSESAARTTIYDREGLTMHIVFAEGSTNGEQGIALTKNDSFFIQENAYNSIEDSHDTSLGIGFRGSFKNISNFAAGQFVGEASKPFASMFLITIGDPLVQRIDTNNYAAGTDFDTGIGTSIYSDPGKTIFKVLPFDFNNDGLEDLLIAHTDGSVALLKNYGGDDPYTDSNNLLLIADTLKDIFVGDVDNNGYSDIIVWTNTNQLRVYNNTQGIFDVDGRMICLAIPGGPNTIDGALQIFVEDMDKDGNIDIVVNDIQGSVTVFYGGGLQNDGSSNYVSSLAYSCDDQWTQRQSNASKLIKQFGVQLDDTLRVVDGSLIHRNGLVMPPDDDPNNPLGNPLESLGGNTIDTALSSLATLYENGDIDTATFQSNMAVLMQSQGPLESLNNFSVDSLVNVGSHQLLRYSPNPFAIIPAYETLDSNDIAYVPITHLEDGDPVSVYKTYKDTNGGILLAGDTVLVTVHIKAHTTTILTFADQIRGPWIISKDSNGSIPSFTTQGLSDSSEIIWDTDNQHFVYMIDNLSVQSGQDIRFSYTVEYVGGSPMTIDVKHIQDGNTTDDYLDIVAVPVDDCAKFSWTFYNTSTNNARSYREVFGNLWEQMEEYHEQLQDNLDNNINQTTDAVGDIGNGLENDLIKSLLNQGRQTQSILDSVAVGNPINLQANINMTLANNSADALSDAFDTALQGLCQGFSIGGDNACAQPPVPFNMSFLTPGTFNIFGCTLFQDKGLPLFFFPGTAYVLGVPVPIPYGLKQSPIDSFYRAPGGVFPSMIRIYVSPTLTAQLGIAICLGPQSATHGIPQPIRDLGGNCIVLTMAMPCNTPSPQVGDNEVYTQQIDARWLDASHGGTCSQNTIMYTKTTTINGNTNTHTYTSSPFTLVAQDPFVPSPVPIIPQNTYGFGFIDLATDPVFVDADMPSFQDFAEDINLKAGAAINLKILGGKATGLVKCLIQDWMDRQVRYIVNNMSKMTVGIYLPDLGQLFAGLDNLTTENMTQLLSQEATLENINKNAGEGLDAHGLEKISHRAQNSLIQQGQLANLAAEINNPFELVGKMFDQVNLVHISNKDVVVPIPFIYSEDVIKYINYLEAWIETNTAIWEERSDVTKSALGICSDRTINQVDAQTRETTRTSVQTRKQQLSTQLDQALANNDADRAQALRIQIQQLEQCDNFTQNARFQQFLAIEENTQILIRAIRQNIKILEQYKQFPLELYQWVHVGDRYLTELSSFVANFFGTISYWLATNAQRFSQYVDAIITLIGVIKTRQVLVDFSINRAESCGTCSNDIYDFYSCSLSMLCPQLPILPIPPFKIPNIYLDMSRINLGMQILLPSFKFVPTTIPLPRIPNFPRPPKISLDIDFSPFVIPDLPILPPPPVLPELPSLIPQVQLELPVLPPAPKIPAISPSIQATINAAEFVGQIMCVIKGQGVGLVSENGVKSKIEQMTQRSWNVPFFDYLDLTTQFRDAPLQGFDYQIDSFVNIQFNFDGVYDTIHQMTDVIGTSIAKPFESIVNKTVDGLTQTINNNPVTDVFETIEGNIDIDIDLFNWNNVQIPEVDYTIVKKDLIAGLPVLATSTHNTLHKQQIAQIQSSLDHHHIVTPAIEHLDTIHTQVQTIVSNKQQELQSLQEQIYYDYDGFLDDIADGSLALVSDTIQESQFSSALFTVDTTTKKLLNTAEHPLVSYLDIQAGLAGGYHDALKNNDALSLNMHPNEHQQKQQYFANITDTIRAGKQLLATNKLSRSVATYKQPAIMQKSTPLLAQTPSSNVQTCTDCTDAMQTSDLSAYIQGIFVKGNNGKLINTVSNKEHIQQIGDNYIMHDLNGDNNKDILMRDSQNIYAKYAHANSQGPNSRTTYSRYYVSTILESPEQLANIVNTQGYISIRSQGGFLAFTDTIRLKVYDRHWEVKNFSIQGQSFDAINLSRDNSMIAGDIPDGYIIQLNHRIDTHQDKYAPLRFMSQGLIERAYILILPNDTSLQDDDRIILPYTTSPTRIRTLLNTQEILAIDLFDPAQESLSVTLEELSRKWKYVQVATLYNRGNENLAVYHRGSPWSQQVVAGTQQLHDTQGPNASVSLIRTATNTVVSSGLDHLGYVSTDYSFAIRWDDNVAVAYNWIQDDNGTIIATYTGNNARIDGLFFSGMTQKSYTIGAVDFSDNFTREDIVLSIDIPMIRIDSVHTTGENAGSIVATLDHDIDRGFVGFDRMRTSVWQTLTGQQNQGAIAKFPLGIGDVVVTGHTFDLSNTVGLYAQDGSIFARIDPLHGTIAWEGSAANRYTMGVDFASHLPMIKIRDTIAGQQVFQIYYAPSSLYGTPGVTILDPSIQLQTLGSHFDTFAGGRCIQQHNDCISYISPTGHIYVPTPRHTSLSAEVLFNDEYISYIVKNAQGNNLYSINIVIAPLIGQ